MDYDKLADLLLPDVNMTVENIEKMYPKRNLPVDAKVTRIAPSPTGLIHMGVVYAALISERLAHQSDGVFYLRIEDTDKKREVKGSIPEIIKSLGYFGIRFDEGEVIPEKEIGNYGPYKQSERRHIYRVFVKELLKKGMAYPCFCSIDNLIMTRNHQKEVKELTGYYGKWARCRNITINEIQHELIAGNPFVIRLKSPGDPNRKVAYNDLVKGEIKLPENIQDVVILKSDGLPTYHFAHAIDDYLMGTTHVFRGDEWLSSVPIHLQLFMVLGWNPPFYGHISPIMKMDGTSKRKFSKRKDPEFAVSWYRQQGYPGPAITEYLLGLVNSNFEDWHLKNPHEPYSNFIVAVKKLSGSGALFDINKMDNICRNAIADLNSEDVYHALIEWTSEYDIEFYDLITKYKAYAMIILSIGRDISKPRKDYANWSNVKPAISYFYDELFNKESDLNSLPETVSSTDAIGVINEYINIYNEFDDKTIWFEKIKNLCDRMGYARDMKSFKENPSSFKLHIGDVAMVLRIALTGRTNTPELYDIMQIMGIDRVIKRYRAYTSCS